MNPIIKELTVKSAIHKHCKKGLPYKCDLNIYRGCLHKCAYCFAQYSHKYLNNNSKNNFFSEIYVKKNIVSQLRKDLEKKSWGKEVINLGGVCDSYQPLEAKYQFMPKILKLMIKHKNPILIATKSDLILRDKELIEKLASIADVDVAISVTTMNEKVRKLIEPGASPASKRFNAIKELKGKYLTKTLLLMPIIPLITDSEANLDAIFMYAQEAGIDNIVTGTLYLRGETRKYFLSTVKENFPHLHKRFLELYKTAYLSKKYKDGLYRKVNRLKKKHGFDRYHKNSSNIKIKRTAKNRNLVDWF